jgi:hypothetical protein
MYYLTKQYVFILPEWLAVMAAKTDNKAGSPAWLAVADRNWGDFYSLFVVFVFVCSACMLCLSVGSASTDSL